MRCDICKPIKKYFGTHRISKGTFDNYMLAYKAIEERVFANEMELIVGDCELDEIDDCALNIESFVFLKHYFRCSKCGKIFFIGLYCRGEAACFFCKSVPGIDTYAHPDYWGGIKFGTLKRKKDWKSENGKIVGE